MRMKQTTHNKKSRFRQLGITRNKEWMSSRTEMRHDHRTGQPEPSNAYKKKHQTTTPAPLKDHCPCTKRGHNKPNLLFTSQRQQCKDKDPYCTARIHEIEHEKQKCGSKCHCMKIKAQSLLLCRIEQIEHSNYNSG